MQILILRLIGSWISVWLCRERGAGWEKGAAGLRPLEGRQVTTRQCRGGGGTTVLTDSVLGTAGVSEVNGLLSGTVPLMALAVWVGARKPEGITRQEERQQVKS